MRRVIAASVRLLPGTVLALVAVLATAGCGAGAPADANSGGTNVVARAATTQTFAPGQRKAAPQVRGELLGGGSYDLSAHRGEVVVINFWGSWCAPCRAEAPELEAVHQRTRDAGVSFLGINSRDGRDAAIAFADGRLSYPSVFDPAGRVGSDFTDPPIGAYPVTVVVDRQGRIAAVVRQRVLRDDFAPLVERIAAEPR
jgi:thiol-disulfide isomerase/thioredoxin